jgi:hypothetical protein
MIARYNQNEYIYVSNRRRKEIVTTKCSKNDGTFTLEKGLFYKKIAEEEITDIYDLEYWVKYESGLPNVSEWWKIGSEQNAITDDHVILLFAEGILPGWKIEEKNVCSNEVKLTSVSGAKIKVIYRRKDNRELQIPITEERIVKISELNEMHKKYSRNNM